MSVFAVFGLCLVIVIIFLIIVGIMMGPQFFMLFILIPVLISEAITGQRGSFHPNGASKKAPFFEAVLLFSVVIQVLLVSSILFGIYWLIAGRVAAPAAIPDAIETFLLTSAEVSQLFIVNSLLWLLVVVFAGMFIVNTIRYWKEISRMPEGSVFTNYVIPPLMFIVVFLFLFASRNFLDQYTQGKGHLSLLMQALAIGYGLYLVITKISELYMYVKVLRKHRIKLWKGYWFTMFLSISYILLFNYFLIRILSSV